MAAAAIGGAAVTFSLGQVTGRGNPALAHELVPYDGRITARLALSLAEAEDADAADRERSDALARRALQQDATAVDAAAALGTNALIRDDAGSARRFFTYANALSRRNLRTQLWSIEEAVTRGDVPGALRNYDIALRTRPTLSEMLYPVLGGAIADPAIRRELVRTLKARPNWADSFLGYVGAGNVEAATTVRLLADLARAGVAIPASAQAGAVNVLVQAGSADEAWRYYALIRPGADRRRSRDPGFRARLDPPSQLDWTPMGEGGVTTTIQDGVADFAAPASVGGPLLQQVQLLPPGSYRLTGRTAGIEQVPGARPYWSLRCRDGRELARVEVPNSAVANGGFAGNATVPADCPIQTLQLVARPSDAISGLSGQLLRAELAPVGR